MSRSGIFQYGWIIFLEGDILNQRVSYAEFRQRCKCAAEAAGSVFWAIDNMEYNVPEDGIVKNKVWVYFYGSNIDLNVLKKVGFEPDEIHVARLNGYDIQISPLANLVRSDRHCTYGTLVAGTHEELDRLYGQYVQKELGATYLPEAVVCEKADGSLVPALCYIAAETPVAPATTEYLARILIPAREFGFPDWYIERLESFASIN